MLFAIYNVSSNHTVQRLLINELRFTLGERVHHCLRIKSFQLLLKYFHKS